MKLNDNEVNERFREAFEDTIALLDRVGFFLLHPDSLLMKEVPTLDMGYDKRYVGISWGLY